ATFFFFQAEDGIRDGHVTGVQTCALPISCCRRLRLRRAGNKVFADLVITVARTSTFGEAHEITEAVEEAVRRALPRADVDVVVRSEERRVGKECKSWWSADQEKLDVR